MSENADKRRLSKTARRTCDKMQNTRKKPIRVAKNGVSFMLNVFVENRRTGSVRQKKFAKRRNYGIIT